MSTPSIPTQTGVPNASVPVPPPITLILTPRVARKAISQSVARLPVRQDLTQQQPGQPSSLSPSTLGGATPVDSAKEEAIVSPNISHCGVCKGVFRTIHAIWCLICCSGNEQRVISNLCLVCYDARAGWDGHNHDMSFYACESDPVLSDIRLQQYRWSVRRNASQRLWYERDDTGYKTYMRPMTAVCELPSGWQQKKDPEGKIYYENSTTGQLSRTLPGALPLGWQETKDPDGRLFFVHHELELASWHRPGKQPPVPTLDSGTGQETSSSAENTADGVVIYSKPDAISKPAQVVVTSSPVAITPNVIALAAAVNSTSLPPVTLQTATEATINLIDPSQGKIVLNTKIASHIATRGVSNTFKAIKHSERLQKFAKGTGITKASRQVQIAWTKAEREVMASNQRALALQSRPRGADTCAGQESNGQQQQHQHHISFHQLQSPQQHTNAPPSTNSSLNPVLAESIQRLCTGQGQGVYADEIENILIAQAQGQTQDFIIAQGQDFGTGQDLGPGQDFIICQDTFVDDQLPINLGPGQRFEIEEKLGGVEFNGGVIEQVGNGGVVVDIDVDFCPGVDLGYNCEDLI